MFFVPNTESNNQLYSLSKLFMFVLGGVIRRGKIFDCLALSAISTVEIVAKLEAELGLRLGGESDKKEKKTNTCEEEVSWPRIYAFYLPL